MEILNKLKPYKHQKRDMEFRGKTYPLPYQTIFIKSDASTTKIAGIRDCENRVSLFEGLLKSSGVDGGNYLDIGCNLAYFPYVFSDRFAVHGVESDSHYWDFSRELYPEISENILNYDLNKVRLKDIFPNKRFHFITALSIIEYIEDKVGLVSDVFSMLESGGLAIFEGHILDINNGNDLIYQNIIESQNWSVLRLEEVGDSGLSAPLESLGRPIWACLKK